MGTAARGLAGARKPERDRYLPLTIVSIPRTESLFGDHPPLCCFLVVLADELVGPGVERSDANDPL